MHAPPAPLLVVGEPALAERLGQAGVGAGGAAVVVVGGPVGERVARARAAVSDGAHAFVLWPPGVSADEAAALGARAEEAGVEVGVARPPGHGARAGWPGGGARLVTLSVVAAAGGPLAAAGWPALLAGALGLSTALAASRDVARLDAEAERQGGRLQAVAVALRFRTGAFAALSLRTSAHAAADEVALYAARPGVRAEARSLDGPLCVETEAGRTVAPAPDLAPDLAEIAAFVDAARAGGPVPHRLDTALGTLRLVERVQAALR